LKKAGLKHIKIEECFTHKPLSYDLGKATKQFLDRFLPADTLILHLDDKGPCHAKRYGGLCWSNTRLKMDIRQPVHDHGENL